LAIYYRNVSILFADLNVEFYYAFVYNLGPKSEPLLCKLEDEVVHNNGLRMVMIGDPLLRRISEIIDRVVEAGFYNFWISVFMHET